jgi:hypothetical protein
MRVNDVARKYLPGPGCGFGFDECPAEASNAGNCVLSPADTDKCPVFSEDNTTLIILVILGLMFGAYLAAATIAACVTRPKPMCTLVIELPEVGPARYCSPRLRMQFSS